MTEAKVKAVFSNNYRRLMKQFPKLPKECRGLFSSCLKRDALRTIKNFKEGIRTNSLHLIKLQDGTIVRKRAQGLPHPTFPLYGHGDEFKETSYMNMLRIKPKGEGFVVHPSKQKHHSQAIKLDALWDVHEHGALIKGKGGVVIRIPPRPALRKAFQKAMRERKIKETSKVLKLSILLYLKTRQKAFLKKAENHFLNGLDKYEIAG